MPSILHVSDVHFGPKHLPELSGAVLELARAARPDAIVVSGDFTQRAKPGQFGEAADWLRKLNELSCPVAHVPGNHDVPLYRVWERVFSPFGVWRRWLDRDLVREVEGEELSIFGLNTSFAWTTKHGRVERRELAALEGRLAGAAPDRFRVLVAHHPLAHSAELGSEPVARRGGEALDLARRSGIELVLAGHLHHGFWFESGGGGPIVVHCGTTSSSRGRGPERGRSSLNWIEVEPASVKIERRFWHAASGAFRPEAAVEFARRRAAAS